MATGTESNRVIFQKILSLGGTMRVVAADAPFFHRIMLELCFSYRSANILVTIETELIPALQKDKLVF